MPPRSWQSSSQEWDTNKVYGLSLPKYVVRNRLTRDLGIADMPIFEVPLAKVVSQQHQNWALRQIAHGRTVTWENFRSKQESVFAGVLMRALRGDSAQSDGMDFVTILNAEQRRRHPTKELHDWEARYDTIKFLAESLATQFRKHAPTKANQDLLTRVQALERENASLKSRTSASLATTQRTPKQQRPSPKATPPSTRRKPPCQEEEVPTEEFPVFSPVGDAVEGHEDVRDDEEPHDVFDEEEPLLAPQDTYAQFRCPPGGVKFLESCSLTRHNISAVNTWLASTTLGKGKKQALDLAVSEFMSAAGKLDAGSRVAIDTLAVEWGLPVQLAAKLNEACLVRLLAGAHLLSQE